MVSLLLELRKFFGQQVILKERQKRLERVGCRNVYKHQQRFVVLNIRWLLPTFVGFAYFHIKGMKKDRGRGVSGVSVGKEPALDIQQPAAGSLPNPEDSRFGQYEINED